MKKKKSLQYYADVKRRLSVVHRFSFKTRKNFTPQQKSAISRMWKKYKNDVDKIELGQAVVKKVPKKFYEGTPALHRSNKGIIYYRDIISTERKKQAKRTRVEYLNKKHRDALPHGYIIELKGKELEVLVPLSRDDEKDLELFVRRLIDRFKPYQVLFQINGYHGKSSYDPKIMYRYAHVLMMELTDSRQKYSTDDDITIVTGVFLLYPNTAKWRKYWGV